MGGRHVEVLPQFLVILVGDVAYLFVHLDSDFGEALHVLIVDFEAEARLKEVEGG